MKARASARSAGSAPVIEAIDNDENGQSPLPCLPVESLGSPFIGIAIFAVTA